MKKLLLSNDGLTLTEIIVTIVISLILVAGIGRMMNFNVNLFGEISEKTNVQSELRFMMEDIERKIGTATYVELVDIVGTPSGDEVFVFVEESDGKGLLKQKNTGGTTTIGGNGGIVDFTLTITIKVKSGNSDIVTVTLDGPDGASMTQEIYLQNVNDAIGTAGNTYTAVKYIPVTP